MSAIRIASRYAKSLIDLATEQDKMDKVVADIQLFRESLNNRDLLLMIKSPIINADKKKNIFKALFNDRIDPLTFSFFDIIIRKGRETYLPEIATEFINQYKTLNNITNATVTTATALNSEQLARVKSELIKLGIATGKVELETKVDPNIIGGFVLEVGDQLYDASVKNKLGQLKKEILDNTYIKSL